MDMKEFIDKFIDAVEIEDSAMITPDIKFRELDEWNSLSTLSLIAMADEEYGVELNPDVFRNSETVADLFHAIQSLK